MPSLTGRFSSWRPIVNLGIAPAGAIRTAAVPPPPAGTPGAPPLQTVTTFPALIDTGADITCISPTVAQALGLRPRGKRPMNSATHSGAAAVAVNLYLVDVAIPFNPAIILPGLAAAEWTPPPNSSFHVLLGRDILCRGVFTMSFDGHFSFSI